MRARSRNLRSFRLVLSISLISFVLACGNRPPAGVTTAPVPAVAAQTGVERVALSVRDLDAETRFFTTVLGFENEGTFDDPAPAELLGIQATGVRGVRLRLGSEHIALIAYGSGRDYPDGSRSNDRWFQHLAIVVSDIDRAWQEVSVAGGRAISQGGPQTIPMSNPAAGGIRAMYFRDPEGHPLELIWYPHGKGQPRWQQAGGRLFLGIDHTAIASGSTEKSIRFYRGLLGLEVAGESLNTGREQEALSGVATARVHITGLHGAAGFGVELLEYLEPLDGRVQPGDTRIDDLWSTETTLFGDVEHARAHAAEFGATIVSAVSAVSAQPATAGQRRELLLRDPDGHAVRVVQP